MTRIHRSAAVAWTAFAALAAFFAVLHLAVNFTNIDQREVWGDEASTALVAMYPWRRVLTLPIEYHSQPPLYYLLVHGLELVNSSELALRGLSWLLVLGFVAFVLFALDELGLAARWAMLLLFVTNDFTRYLSQELRPYALGQLVAFAATVLFWRLCAAPDDRRLAAGYLAALLAALYTIAFDCWLLPGHALFAALLVAARARSGGGLAGAVRELRLPLGALALAGAAYLPYLRHAIVTAPARDPVPLVDTLRAGLNVRAYADCFRSWAPPAPWSLGVFALIAFGLAMELKRGNRAALLMVIVFLGQIGFVSAFLYGKSPVGVRYSMPACGMWWFAVGLGVHHLLARLPTARTIAPLALAAASAVLLSLSYPAYARYRAAPAPADNWRRLYRELARIPGKKGLFFSTAGYGQMLEYVARDDRSFVFFTDGFEPIPGTGLSAAGTGRNVGAVPLPDDYIRARIAEHAGDVRCFFFSLDQRTGGRRQFRATFMPALRARGFVEAFHSVSGDVPDPFHDWFDVRGFCAPERPPAAG